METRIYVSDKIQKNYKKVTLNELPRESDMNQYPNSWNANYVPISGKRCWVITHSITRYTLIISDVRADKIVNFRELFSDCMINQLNKKHVIDPNEIQRFIGAMKFHPTNGDRSCIAYLNKRIEDLSYWKSELDELSGTIGSNMNEIGTKLLNGKSKYIHPTEEMLNLINGAKFD